MAEMVQAGCEKAVGEHQEAEAGDETKPAGRPKGKQGNFRDKKTITHT